ncbi:MAG TPA: transposase [Epulopiscium sp.]|nr:transposase [Candidatus Epulonipiscium sp.]
MGRKNYEQTFKDRIVQLHLEEARTISSLNKEYQLGSGTINNRLKVYRKACLAEPQKAEEKDTYGEIHRLRKELEEMEKENRFLKKAAAFFAKEID